MEAPKISVIMLVYNVEAYLERALDSLLQQDFRDYELLLVVEARSTDRSLDICQTYMRTDSRIRICMEDGTGFPAARNRGLEEARGEYVTFVDADDYVLPGMFTSMYRKASEENLDILCCGGLKDLGGQSPDQMADYVRFPEEAFAVTLATQRNFIYNYVINGRTATAWGKLYRRMFLNQNGLRFHPHAYSDDMVFNYWCYTHAERVGAVAEAFYVYYDRHDSRLYTGNTAQAEQSAEILWDLYLGYAGDSPDEVRAFAAARIISSTLFNLKLQRLPIKDICREVDGLIERLGMRDALQHAADDASFRDYADAVGMKGPSCENFLCFLRSLQNYEAMLEWQMHYETIAGKKVGA